MNKHYCCNNIIPSKTDDNTIKCLNCGKTICHSPQTQEQPIKYSYQLSTDGKKQLKQIIENEPQLTPMTEIEIKAVKNEFKRLNFTKEKIRFCSRETIKKVLKNVRLTQHHEKVEYLREKLVFEKW